MRTSEEMLLLFDRIVQADSRIRLSVLEGSRTNPSIKKGAFMDYDLSFFVNDQKSMIQDDHWLQAFGTCVFMQKPEDMELFEPELGNWFSYLMYLEDGNKVDLTLIPINELEMYLGQSDGLVQALVDKDHRLKQEMIPSDKYYWIKRPTAREFDDCCNEFWSVATYVAKGLYRNEFLFALDHLNQILRPELLRMISWEAGLRLGFTFSPGKNYKLIQQYISEEAYDRVITTFRCAGVDETWTSFRQCCQLFREYSKQVAQILGVTYPHYDQTITDMIERVFPRIHEQGF